MRKDYRIGCSIMFCLIAVCLGAAWLLVLWEVLVGRY